MKVNFIFFIFFFFLFSTISKAKIETKIILKIGNEIVTNFDVKNEIITLLVLAEEEINQENINQLKKRALQSLIDNKLKKIELAKYSIENNTLQVNNYLNSISSNNIQVLKSKFKQNNLDFNSFEKRVENQIKWQSLIFQLYSKKIRIDENLIDEELKSFLKNKNNKIAYKISEIEIDLEEDNNRIDKVSFIKEQIKINGFGSAALKYSTSSSAINKGDLGWINANSLTNEILLIIKNMEIGEISEPINKKNSIMFLKLDDKKVSEVEMDMNKLKTELIKKKQNELFNLYSQSHLSKLRNNNIIEYK